MRKLLISTALILLAAGAAQANDLFGNNRGSSYGGIYGTGSNPNSHQVDSYTRRDGTYVPSYQRTNPNDSLRDNYRAPGNYNPNRDGVSSGSRYR